MKYQTPLKLHLSWYLVFVCRALGGLANGHCWTVPPTLVCLCIRWLFRLVRSHNWGNRFFLPCNTRGCCQSCHQAPHCFGILWFHNCELKQKYKRTCLLKLHPANCVHVLDKPITRVLNWQAFQRYLIWHYKTPFSTVNDNKNVTNFLLVDVHVQLIKQVLLK